MVQALLFLLQFLLPTTPLVLVQLLGPPVVALTERQQTFRSASHHEGVVGRSGRPPWTTRSLASGYTPTSSNYGRRRIASSFVEAKKSSSGLLSSSLDSNGESSSLPSASSSSSSSSMIRFLGKGENAIVRPGVVLVSPSHESTHFYRQCALFVHAMGEREDDGVYVIRGVLLDHPTPFTLGEMMPQLFPRSSSTNSNGNNDQQHPLAGNLMFRGGDQGGEGVILLHDRALLGESSSASSAIGLSGIYQGGWDAALAAISEGRADASNFKVFFNYCEFTEVEITNMLRDSVSGDSASYDEEGNLVREGDGWISVEVPTEFILNGEYDRGEAWARVRNSVNQLMQKTSPPAP